MLFTSAEFIFVFLPIVLTGFAVLARVRPRLIVPWLAAASLFFFAWWDYRFVPLLVGSVVFNFNAGLRMASSPPARKRTWLVTAIAVNLVVLGYFKYANFFLSNVGAAIGTSFPHLHVILPAGISFFTFTQIAFLVDTYRHDVREYAFGNYFLFVTYFPHLIAGPILHHSEMMPQFGAMNRRSVSIENLAVGLTIFIIGLAKKTMLADSVSPYADQGFGLVEAGGSLSFLEAWMTALAYTFQLYFDFSGYCDMAIGISKMLGVRLPLNFDSPYKSKSIVEFWRRWHMTLSRFLRDYLYIALGGNRKGPTRRYANLMSTMLLGGLWHGAGWTFVVWGGLHGLYLVVNHAWSALLRRLGFGGPGGPAYRAAAWLITFLSVVVAWVFFRATSAHAALHLLKAMIDPSNLQLRERWAASLPAWLAHIAQLRPELATSLDKWDMLRISGMLVLVLALPNTQQLLARYRPALDTESIATPVKGLAGLRWQPTLSWAFAIGALAACALVLNRSSSPFIYFNF